jgi:hypothetical protein
VQLEQLRPLGWIGDLQGDVEAEILFFQESHQAPQVWGGAVVGSCHQQQFQVAPL